MHEEIAKVHSVAQKFPQERRDFTDKGLENTLKGLTSSARRYKSRFASYRLYSCIWISHGGHKIERCAQYKTRVESRDWPSLEGWKGREKRTVNHVTFLACGTLCEDTSLRVVDDGYSRVEGVGGSSHARHTA